VSSVSSSDHPHIRQILDVLERDPSVSQRSLASRLGIALGLTNLLLKRLVIKGWVRVVRVRPNRVRYLLTPTGIAEKARMSRAYLQYSIHFYADARDRIRETFAALSLQLPPPDAGATRKRIVFYGTGEVAEIGYVCLQETDLELVAVIDDSGRQRFFNVPVHSSGELSAGGLGGAAFDRLVVMSFDGDGDQIRTALARTGFPEDKTFWI
jgi:DNA-binding MarR family transcriptional regulator